MNVNPTIVDLEAGVKRRSRKGHCPSGTRKSTSKKSGKRGMCVRTRGSRRVYVPKIKGGAVEAQQPLEAGETLLQEVKDILGGFQAEQVDLQAGAKKKGRRSTKKRSTRKSGRKCPQFYHKLKSGPNKGRCVQHRRSPSGARRRYTIRGGEEAPQME